MIDLSPSNDPADLVDAIYSARRENRRDLQPQLEHLLEHPEPIVREEALSVLLTKWRVSSLREKARSLLLNDNDSGVRARAAIGLASVTSSASRGEDAMLLGRVYADPNSGTSVRQASFEALSLMAGRPTVVELDDTSVRQVQELIQEINSKQS